MKLVYISHPYTGDEIKNRVETREMCKQIQHQHKDWCLYCPLDNHIFAEQAGYEYSRFIEWDLFMLAKCDIAVFCGDWERSKGCMAEYKEAKRLKKEIYFERVNKS